MPLERLLTGSSSLGFASSFPVRFLNKVPIGRVFQLILTFSVLTMVGMFFVPSSPVFLLSQDREQEARKALQWLRGPNYDIEKEIQEVS